MEWAHSPSSIQSLLPNYTRVRLGRVHTTTALPSRSLGKLIPRVGEQDEAAFRTRASAPPREVPAGRPPPSECHAAPAGTAGAQRPFSRAPGSPPRSGTGRHRWSAGGRPRSRPAHRPPGKVAPSPPALTAAPAWSRPLGPAARSQLPRSGPAGSAALHPRRPRPAPPRPPRARPRGGERAAPGRARTRPSGRARRGSGSGRGGRVGRPGTSPERARPWSPGKL